MSLIRAVVQDETGIQVGEDFVFSGSLLSGLDERRYLWLRFVDPYGDTVFNRLQMPTLLDELRCLEKNASTLEAHEFLARLIAIAEVCLEQPHLYLKFIGD